MEGETGICYSKWYGYNINWRHSVVSETYIQKTLKQPQDKKQRRIANETIARIKSKQKYSKEGR